MLEGVLEGILTQYFGEYVDGLDVKHLSVGLLSGEVRLNDLSLKTGALDELRLPIDVKAGYIKSIFIKIPLSPWSTPVKIVIDGIYVLAVPQSVAAYGAQGAARAENSIKRKRLLHADTLRSMHEKPADSKEVEAKGLLERCVCLVCAGEMGR